jgi:hypothetical protein
MKNFSSFLTEADDNEQAQKPAPRPEEHNRVSDDMVATFGRYNPPHKGHLRTMDFASKLADDAGADQRFYASRSHDKKKNPLDYNMKVGQLKKMFPQHADKWDSDENVRTILQAAKKAHGQGYKNFHFVGGADRKQGMEDLLRRYNGDLYNFDNIYSHSAGDRDATPADPIAGLSASGQRKFAMDDDFDGFKQGLDIGENYTEEDAAELFSLLRQFMIKNEDNGWEVDYRSNRDLICEMYRDGELYQAGDLVESLITGLRGHVHRCGANHLICVTEDGVMFKSFIQDVQKV